MTTRTSDKSTFYAEQIGPKRSLTPEGFLLCHDVRIARTGVQEYGTNEVPVEDDGSGRVMVDRQADDVFRPETLSSFEGKPVTIGHPDEFVSPDNFGALACGVTLNVRRGDGADVDYMVADLLITTKDAIATIQQFGIREVSCGYEADYEQGEPGRAVQRNIVGNHVALVARGRCGSSCSIGDHAMSNPKKSVLARFLDAFKSKDEKEMEKCAKEAEDEAEAEEAKKEDKKTADALKPILDAIKKIGDDVEELKKAKADDKDDDDDKTEDTVINAETGEKLSMEGVKLYTGDALRVIAQRAEIIAPGFKVPTLDAKVKDGARVKALCGCQRKALDTAYATEDGKAAIDPFLMGRSIATLDLASLNHVFAGASELMKRTNNGGANPRASVTMRDFGKAPPTNDAINKANREYYANRNKA